MKKIYFCLAVVISSGAIAQAEYIVELDRNTGHFNKISDPIPFVSNVRENVRTYDRVHGAFYFQSTATCSCLTSVDITSGDLLYEHQAGIASFQYDNLASKLVGIKFLQNSGFRQFGEIDTATGDFTQIGNDILAPSSLPNGWSTYDAVQKLYYIEGSPSNWTVISAVTGAILANQTLSLAPNETLLCPSFNELDSTNYGLVYNSVYSKMSLAKFEIGTGVVTKLGSGKVNYFGNNGSSAIDPIRKQFLHLSRLGSLYYISIFDLVTGNYIETSDLNPIENAENFVNLEYDKTRDKLLALHWSKSLDYVGISETKNEASYLNRNQEGTRYELSSKSQYSSIEITDILGRIVSTEMYQQNGYWIIEKGNLSAGTYCLRCKLDNEVVSTAKLIFD